MSVCTGGSWMVFLTWENSTNCTVICNTHDWWTPLHSNMFLLCAGSRCRSSPQPEYLDDYFHGQMTLNTMCRSRVSTSVNSIMFQQTRLIYQQLCTFEAAGRFFPSVNSLMCYQWFFLPENDLMFLLDNFSSIQLWTLNAE